MSDFSFRVRFNRAPTRQIVAAVNEIALPGDPGRPALKLAAHKSTTPLEDSDRISLVGSGYETAEAALAAGQRFQDALTVALARLRIGADFGDRARRGVFTKDGLAWVASQHGSRVLNNVHGLMVYPSQPTPLFASMEAVVRDGKSVEAFIATFAAAASKVNALTPRERVSSALFNASFFQDAVDSRFMLLVMAVEVMLEPIDREQQALDHVTALMDATKKSSSLSDAEKESMLGSLKWLRKESIGQTGRRLAREKLSTRTYNGRSAESFFSHAYSVRSNLAHGNLPLPTLAEVTEAAAGLEQFVSHLLTDPYLGSSQEAY